MPNPTPVDLELDWVLGRMPQKVHGVGEEAEFLPVLAHARCLCFVTCVPTLP